MHDLSRKVRGGNIVIKLDMAKGPKELNGNFSLIKNLASAKKG